MHNKRDVTYDVSSISDATAYCLWGQQGKNKALNGEYTYNGEYNGAPSYVKTIDSSCSIPTLYLYKAPDSSWIVYVSASTEYNTSL